MSLIETKVPSRFSNIENKNAPQIIVPNRKGREPEQDYNQIYAHDSDTVAVAKLESWIAKKVGETLMRVYPQRHWGVRVDLRGRMIIIVCETVSITRGYHIKMNQMPIAGLCDAAVDGAAEILERHGITRGKYFNADIAEAMERDHKGDMIGGDHG